MVNGMLKRDIHALMHNKGPGNCLIHDVWERNDLGPTGKSVNASKHVSATVGCWQGTHEIDVYSLETTPRGSKSGEWGDRVPLHFGFLAL